MSLIQSESCLSDIDRVPLDVFSNALDADAFHTFRREHIDFFLEELFEERNETHEVVKRRLRKLDDKINVALLSLPARCIRAEKANSFDLELIQGVLFLL